MIVTYALYSFAFDSTCPAAVGVAGVVDAVAVVAVQAFDALLTVDLTFHQRYRQRTNLVDPVTAVAAAAAAEIVIFVAAFVRVTFACHFHCLAFQSHLINTSIQ